MRSEKAAMPYDPEYQKQYREANRARLTAYHQEWSETNREKLRTYHSQWREKNREKMREHQRAYYEANKELCDERSASWALANPGVGRERLKKWRAEHKERYGEQVQRRRARKMQAPINDLTAAQWQAIKEHYGHRCVYCGKKQERLTQDHLTPLSKGGNHTASNIVPACRSCNSRKHTGPVLVPVQPLLLVAL